MILECRTPGDHGFALMLLTIRFCGRIGQSGNVNLDQLIVTYFVRLDVAAELANSTVGTNPQLNRA